MMTYNEEVAEGTFRLDTQIPGLNTLFAVYFIKDDTEILIIEPGPAAVIPTIQAEVRDLDSSDLRYIIPTHLHLDHAGGLGKLMQMFPHAEAVVGQEGAKHIIDPSRLVRSTKMAFGEDFDAVYGSILPVPESRVRIVQDGGSLFIGERELLVLKTPGHAPHHIAILDTKTRGLFCGEALGLVYRAGFPPLPAVAPPNFDPDVYVESMERLRQLRPRLLFYSHGETGNDPDALISSAIENTRIVGDIIRGSLEMGKSEAEVVRSTGDFIQARFGVKLDEYDLESNVRGYVHYFKRMGITGGAGA